MHAPTVTGDCNLRREDDTRHGIRHGLAHQTHCDCHKHYAAGRTRSGASARPGRELHSRVRAQGKTKITIEDLLTHRGGLIPDNSLKDYQHGTDEAWQRIWNLELVSPVGEKFIYTDVGFLVLGEVVRRVSGQNVAEFAKANIFQPLGMNDSGYLPDESRRARAATTEQREGEWLRGIVHDPRAALLEGIAGHAGLFSTADDMALYANMMLSDGAVGDRQILSPRTIYQMTTARDVAGHRRGWAGICAASIPATAANS